MKRLTDFKETKECVIEMTTVLKARYDINKKTTSGEQKTLFSSF